MLPAIFGLSGLELTDDERELFRSSDPLGFILFARNIDTPTQVLALTDALRELSGRADLPILVDQGRGRVARLGLPTGEAGHRPGNLPMPSPGSGTGAGGSAVQPPGPGAGSGGPGHHRRLCAGAGCQSPVPTTSLVTAPLARTRRPLQRWGPPYWRASPGWVWLG